MSQCSVNDILVVDGDWVPLDQLAILVAQFARMDLREGLHHLRTFELALCIEVAEHLPPRAGDLLVAALSQAAPAVVFSTAIPQQEGTDHINEQWPSYWL